MSEGRLSLGRVEGVETRGRYGGTLMVRRV